MVAQVWDRGLGTSYTRYSRPQSATHQRRSRTPPSSSYLNLTSFPAILNTRTTLNLGPKRLRTKPPRGRANNNANLHPFPFLSLAVALPCLFPLSPPPPPYRSVPEQTRHLAFHPQLKSHILFYFDFGETLLEVSYLTQPAKPTTPLLLSKAFLFQAAAASSPAFHSSPTPLPTLFLLSYPARPTERHSREDSTDDDIINT